jgi:subtilisin family serine protease
MNLHFLTTNKRQLTIITTWVIAILLTLFFWKEKKSFLKQVPQFFADTTSSLKQAGLLSTSLFTPATTELDVLSKEELQEFPGARVVEATEIEGPKTGEKTRIRILETHFKYPYIRTEETIDKTSGNILHRCEMVATHILVRLPAEENPEHFLGQLGPDAISLERVTTEEPLYRLQLSSHSLVAVPQVLNEITQKLSSKLPEAANNCVAPVLASSSIDGTLSRCAPSTPCSLSPSATLKTGSHKQLAVVGQEPDFLIHASMQPNNPLYSQQWYLWKSCSNIEGFWDKRIFFSTIDAFDAWEIQNSAESVVVAVIDTGIRYTHEDLAANMWHENNPMYGTICGWNFSVKDDDPKKNDPMDGLGHGTACAGIIGALGNSGVGIAGIAWKVKLMALKFLNDQGIGSVSNAVSSIDFACEHGAQILNCSWGYVPTSDDPKAINHIFPDQATALQASIKRARDQGVIVVTAAGNEGKDNDQHPEYPANYPLDNIISVASTTEDNQLASFSSYGATTVHLAAPGEEIFSTWARNDHDYITTETREDILNSILNPDKKEDLDFSKQPCGTSFSVPQVVGALALMKERFPTWTYQQLIKRLIDTSDKIPSLEGKMVGGKLNVARALSNPVLPSSTY